MVKLRISGFKTFGVKRLRVVANTKELFLLNLFGFGIWIIKNGAPWIGPTK